ncbi:RNA polymerase sigma factor [Spirosoma jeollabukense]
MEHSLTDSELIGQYLITQPRRCHELLYHRYRNKVYYKCLSMTRDPDLAQDYTQDIFIKALARLSQFSHRARFSSWLFAITHHYCVDQLHRSKRVRTVWLDDTFEWTFSEAVEPLDQEVRLLGLAQAIEQLSPLEQALLRLKYEQGWSLQALAKQYALKVDIVKMRLKRSRVKVQRIYAKAQPK